MNACRVCGLTWRTGDADWCPRGCDPDDLPPPDPHHTLPRVAVATSEREFNRHGAWALVYLFPHIDCAEGDCLAGARLIAVGNDLWRPAT